MAVSSREELKQYALRELGEPVIKVNVDDSQLEDRLDEALEFFREYHHDGIEKVYLKHQITATDIQNRWIPIPDLIYGVSRILPLTRGASSRNMFDVQYQLRLHDLYDLTSTSIIYYNTIMEHISLLDHVLNGHEIIRFNRYQNKLTLDVNWGFELVEGQYIVVEAYRALDPEEYKRMYSNPWLKKYVSALFKRQWGANLKKFPGIQLLGGVTLDGQSMYDEAEQEISTLEDEMRNLAPLEFFTG